ncbi:MAG: D-glycerate dehydrogenase [Patescibacteria group bacterium]
MKVFITRKIPDRGIKMLSAKGHTVAMNPEDRVLTKDELVAFLKGDRYDAVLCLLTDKIDADVFEAAGSSVKIFANMAVGFDNIDVASAKERGIMVTNTPEVLTETVAEHTFALMLAIAHRIAESDRFSRAGQYHGWAPELLLGTDVSHKILGIIGLGRIGSRVAHHASRGFDMRVIYHDVKRNESFEKEFGAIYKEKLEGLMREADFVSIHVPLLPATRHLINAERLKLMKPTAYLINTSRGPIVDEGALRDALKSGTIRGAAIDVWEHEPELTPGLAELENIIITPHTASATEETRQRMGEVAAKNIIEALEGRPPPNLVRI